MTLSGNGVALRSDLQPVGRRCLVIRLRYIRKGGQRRCSTLPEALGGLFKIDEREGTEVFKSAGVL